MYTIKAPNADYNGVSAGVTFVDGVGETDNPSALAYFRRHGYEVTKKPSPPKRARSTSHNQEKTDE